MVQVAALMLPFFSLALRGVAVLGLGLGLGLGCSVPVTAVPVGGSRADATITMAYEYDEFDIPVLDPAQMHNDAKARCQGWGYTDAQAFAGVVRDCIRRGEISCFRWRVSVQFQCLGTP